jgi:hypothetical protein
LPAHHILVVVLSIHNGNFLEPWDQQIILRLTKPGDSSDFWFCLGLLACLLACCAHIFVLRFVVPTPNLEVPKNCFSPSWSEMIDLGNFLILIPTTGFF